MGFFDRFSQPPEIVLDQWNGYTYVFGDGERCIVSFDVRACDPAAQRPSQLRRVIGFSPDEHIGPTGMPSAPALARLRAIEDALIRELKSRRVRSWLIGKQVYRGYRELLFQVDDVAGFARAYASVEADLGGMKLVEHPDWTFFNDKISPGVRGHNHISNRELLGALKSAGADLAAAHTLDHTFVGPTPALDAIEVGLRSRGFHEPSRHDRSLTLRAQTPLDDQDALDAITLSLREAAEEHGAVYDGWGTAPIRR